MGCEIISWGLLINEFLNSGLELLATVFFHLLFPCFFCTALLIIFDVCYFLLDSASFGFFICCVVIFISLAFVTCFMCSVGVLFPF